MILFAVIVIRIITNLRSRPVAAGDDGELLGDRHAAHHGTCTDLVAAADCRNRNLRYAGLGALDLQFAVGIVGKVSIPNLAMSAADIETPV